MGAEGWGAVRRRAQGCEEEPEEAPEWEELWWGAGTSNILAPPAAGPPAGGGLCRIPPHGQASGELQPQVISPDFPLQLTGFFPGKHLIQFLVLKMKDFQNFVLDNCILDFDAEQVYFKLQVTNLKNNEVTVNPKSQTLEKIWFFENPIPYTLYPKPKAPNSP